MPSPRLILAGLLSKYPEKSRVFKRLASGAQRLPNFTDIQKQHMVCLQFTPQLPMTWVAHQFEGHANPLTVKRRIERIAFMPENRKRWEHIAERNLMFIGQKEVFRYYHRRNMNIKAWHPNWALPIFNDHLKEGMKMTEIQDMYLLSRGTIAKLRQRSLFAVHKGARHGPNAFIKGAEIE